MIRCQMCHHLLHVIPHRPFQGRILQQLQRMKCGHDSNALKGEKLSPDGFQGGLPACEHRGCPISQSDDNFRPDRQHMLLKAVRHLR